MDILKNINALLAKLTEKQYAPYKELYESMKEEYDKRYDHIFGVGNNRLYLNDNVEINETTLEAYKIATHKFVKEYFNFSLWCAFDNLDCIGSYKQIIEKKKQEEKDKKEKKCKSNGKN